MPKVQNRLLSMILNPPTLLTKSAPPPVRSNPGSATERSLKYKTVMIEVYLLCKRFVGVWDTQSCIYSKTQQP